MQNLSNLQRYSQNFQLGAEAQMIFPLTLLLFQDYHPQIQTGSLQECCKLFSEDYGKDSTQDTSGIHECRETV